METPWTFEAIGTKWKISVPGGEISESLRANISARIEHFDRMYSRFRDDSWVSELARSAGTYILPADFKPLLSLYQDLYRFTNGKVTPLIGQALVEAGYDANYSLVPQAMHTLPAWEEVIIEGENLVLQKPALLDFGAAGKGYLVDIVAGLLEDEGVNEYIVDAGGDMRVRMPNEALARIGLEHPAAPGQVIGVAELRRGSICGSAGNRRAWDRFTHIIDPDLLRSPQEIAAVWVTAPEARVADGLATALFFMSPEELRTAAHTYSFEYLVVHSDYSVTVSDAFPGELFLRETP